MYQNPIARLQKKIVDRISIERLTQIDAENPQSPIALGTKQLRRIEGCVRRDAARQVDRIPQMGLARGVVLPRRPNFSAYPYVRSGLKIETAKDPNRVEGL
jgi:hypothetical protein